MLVDFGDEYFLDADWTNHPLKLANTIASEVPDQLGGTVLYDAVVASADHMSKSVPIRVHVSCSFSPTAKTMKVP